ncbi:hypothetical protein TNCT_365301 [Trichonephila clavata]|uniref:DUF5641 domain-containing protein n=1 Tax=Trichonephila clavata TaxID=2740835 RepID=A0A8X6L9G5_TRICU|nr:hypothetical protein TNCT_365301 [Trichonephila clavata]
MLKEPSKISMERTLGRIEGLHPGFDGLVRVIRIRTSRGLFTRNVASICPHPFEKDAGPSSTGGGMFPLDNTKENILLNCALLHAQIISFLEINCFYELCSFLIVYDAFVSRYQKNSLK